MDLELVTSSALLCEKEYEHALYYMNKRLEKLDHMISVEDRSYLVINRVFLTQNNLDIGAIPISRSDIFDY